MVDALFIKSRAEDRVVGRAALVVSSIRSDGVHIGESEGRNVINFTG